MGGEGRGSNGNPVAGERRADSTTKGPSPPGRAGPVCELHAVLSGPRVWLRPLAHADIAQLARWEADPVLRHFNDEDPEPASPEETAATVRAWLAPDRTDLRAWAVCLQAHGEPSIGWCMLANVDRAASRCHLGLTIGAREVWGLGYGGEVVRALVAHAHGALGLEVVLGEVFAFNERSRRMLRAAGFEMASESDFAGDGETVWRDGEAWAVEVWMHRQVVRRPR